MKKIISVLVLVLLLASCGNAKKETLYILNWGEYIEEELLTKFEEEFDVKVVLDEVSSNEEMYTRIKSGTTDYDITIPSDYMVEKMINEELLLEIDQSLITNHPVFFRDLVDLQKVYDHL